MLEINHTFIRNVMLERMPNEATKVIINIVEKKNQEYMKLSSQSQDNNFMNS